MTTVKPANTSLADPNCWAASNYGKQIVWRTSMPANTYSDPNFYGAQAAFLLERARPSQNAPVVVQIP
jgi:hypothetical protein